MAWNQQDEGQLLERKPGWGVNQRLFTFPAASSCPPLEMRTKVKTGLFGPNACHLQGSSMTREPCRVVNKGPRPRFQLCWVQVLLFRPLAG